jgi:AcrR family transcriptional regulator
MSVGLRETKAKKTRKRILDEALQLFKRDGYEETKMEAIAEAAEVSPSTLYRYFPSKDLILLHPLISGDDIATVFSRHAENHPLEEALAETILEFAKWQDANSEQILLVRSLIDQAPVARARLWDIVFSGEQNLNACLAEKLHLSENDLRVMLPARLILLTINSTVADKWRASAGKSSSVALAKKVLKMFEEHRVLLPRRAPRR